MGNPIPSRDARPMAWLYCSDDGSQELLLDCNGEQARRLIELGWTEQPLFGALPNEAQIRADAYEQAAKVADAKAALAKRNEMHPAYCLNAVASTAEDLATAIRALSDQPDSTNEGLAELLREKLAAAYVQGATDVHEEWQKNPGEAPRGDGEFYEAALDYADSIDDALSTGRQA